jgi:hypothetical protein
LEIAKDELTALGAEATDEEAPTHVRVRTAIDAFCAYVEQNPAKAELLLFAWRSLSSR